MWRCYSDFRGQEQADSSPKTAPGDGLCSALAAANFGHWKLLIDWLLLRRTELEHARSASMDGSADIRDLNDAQRTAIEYGISDCDDPRGAGPLLIIAGAGTGKTNTLAHRVAHLILEGATPERILLLTFTRRAALEMTRRTQRIVANSVKEVRLPWSGTFHSIGNRLIRRWSASVGLDESFS